MRLTLVVVALVSLTPVARAQQPDTAYARLIRTYTSDLRFLPPSVASLPYRPALPSPRDHFGTIIGAPGVMHDTGEIEGYYRALADASPRVQVEQIGTTEEGRPITLVTIADEATMERLDEYRARLGRLADPRTLPEDQVEAVIDESKPVYYLNGGLHSPEMGSPEMLMELAYRLAADDEPTIRSIRENVITIINPVSEPDGRDKQVDWYHRYTRARTEWDDGFPRSVPYWGRYVVHDNNRDGLQVSQALTRAIFGIFYRWHPTVMLDLHESVPLLYLSTGTGPYNESIDPITIGEWQVLANHDLTSLSAEGLPGVFTWAFYDGWWPGYGIWVANNHNSIGRFYETFGNAGANTYVRELKGRRYAGDPVTERTWYRPDPATDKVRWSARDNVNFMQAGVLASLTYAADNGRLLLRNFHRKGVNSIRRGRTRAPHAFRIPSGQDDPTRTAYLVNQLRLQAIEVHRRTGGEDEGDYVVLLDQPYRDLAVSLLTKQEYPQDAKYPPYDDIAWTLGYLYGVDVEAIDDSTVFAWPGLVPVTEDVRYAGSAAGSGPVWMIDYRAQAGVLPALYWLREEAPRAKAYAAAVSFSSDGDTLGAGSVIMEDLSRSIASEMADRFGLDLRSAPAVPDVPHHALDLPRVAIYHTWYNTQDEGWARYTFEQSGIPYTTIDKDDLRGGRLRQRFDVILVPRVGGSTAMLIQGIDRKWGPMPYTKTDEFPSHGTPDATDDMTGGPGFQGLAGLQQFAEAGGLVITLADATSLVVETGIARALDSYDGGTLFHPGSVVRVKARRPDHPVLNGYPEVSHVFRGNGRLFQVAKRDRSMMLVQYGTKPLPDEIETNTGPMLGIPADEAASAKEAADTTQTDADPYVLSGMVRNEDRIVGQGALFDVPVGDGHVLAFSFNPLHRYLNHHEAPYVWNALLNWNDMPITGEE